MLTEAGDGAGTGACPQGVRSVVPSDPRSWALMTEQGHPGLQGPAIQSRRHSCDASNQGVCVFVVGQTAGREPGRGGALCGLGHLAEEELSWGQAAAGTCPSNINKIKKKRSVTFPSLPSECE